jgi:hypothetical protein
VYEYNTATPGKEVNRKAVSATLTENNN